MTKAKPSLSSVKLKGNLFISSQIWKKIQNGYYSLLAIYPYMLQVEREGLGPAPGYILLWDRKSHALAKIKTKRGSMRKRVVIVVL